MSSTKGWCITSGWMRLQWLSRTLDVIMPNTKQSMLTALLCLYSRFCKLLTQSNSYRSGKSHCTWKKISNVNNSTSHPPLSSYLTSTHHLCARWQEESEWNEIETMEPWVGFRGLVTEQAPLGFNMGRAGPCFIFQARWEHRITVSKWMLGYHILTIVGHVEAYIWCSWTFHYCRSFIGVDNNHNSEWSGLRITGPCSKWALHVTSV